MRLFANAPSKVVGASGGALTEPEPTWKEEISVQEAESILERTFYPFKEVCITLWHCLRQCSQRIGCCCFAIFVGRKSGVFNALVFVYL